MEKRHKIIIVILIILCIIINIVIDSIRYNNKRDNIKHDTVEIVDTIYNKVILDSIEHRIYIKDSTIVELKKKVVYEITQAVNATDSDAVKQFYELAGSN